MKKQIYEIDENGYIKEIHVAEFDEKNNPIETLANNVVTTRPTDGLYRAKWSGAEWIEDMTQSEIDTLNNQPKPPSVEERLASIELAMIDVLSM